MLLWTRYIRIGYRILNKLVSPPAISYVMLLSRYVKMWDYKEIVADDMDLDGDILGQK
jgi:hypothetical protein